MKNITKKLVATIMLTAFALTNGVSAVLAMENAKPVLRDGDSFSMKLKGDSNYIKSDIKISLSLRDSDVKQVLRMFADKAGMNIIFHNSVNGSVTLDLVDVPLNNAFDMIINISNLSYLVQDGTIIVSSANAKNFNMAKQEMTVIPVKYVNATALAEFLNKNIFGISKPGLSSQNVVTTNPASNELIIFGSVNDVSIAKKVVEKFDVKPTTTSFKVNYTTPAEMANMICSMLLPATGAKGTSVDSSSPSSEGGSSDKDDYTGGAAGVMTGAAASDEGSESAEGGEGGESGGSNSSISLNAGTVACSMDSRMDGSFGVQNLSVAYYTQLGTVNVIGGSASQIEMIRDFIANTDKKQPQAYLEVSIIELNEDGSKSLQNNWAFYSNTFSATFDGEKTATEPIHPIFLKGTGYNIVQIEEGGKEKIISSRMPFSGPMQLSYAINYLIKNQKARVIANPRVIITNGETSTIEITDDYIESTESQINTYSGGTYVSRTYNIANDAGIKMEITQFISPDGYVTLHIKPEYATISSQPQATDSYGTYIAATLLSRKNIELKNIRIKDGETLVIAGMISEQEQKTVGKIPVLGDLPVIGTLFRSTSSEKSKSELVLMITPKIVTDSEDAVGNADTL
jgi:type II secretory pathway component GspD/PulD (secretin)